MKKQWPESPPLQLHVEQLAYVSEGMRLEADPSLISGVLLCDPTVPSGGRAEASAPALPHTVFMAQA